MAKKKKSDYLKTLSDSSSKSIIKGLSSRDEMPSPFKKRKKSFAASVLRRP